VPSLLSVTAPTVPAVVVTTTLARGQQAGSLIQTSLPQTESPTQTGSALPRMITLREAVDLALKNNHVVRIAGHEVEANQHAKDVAIVVLPIEKKQNNAALRLENSAQQVSSASSNPQVPSLQQVPHGCLQSPLSLLRFLPG